MGKDVGEGIKIIASGLSVWNIRRYFCISLYDLFVLSAVNEVEITNKKITLEGCCLLSHNIIYDIEEEGDHSCID